MAVTNYGWKDMREILLRALYYYTLSDGRTVAVSSAMYQDISDNIGICRDSVRQYVCRMAKEGLIERVRRGVYRLPPRSGSTTDAL